MPKRPREEVIAEIEERLATEKAAGHVGPMYYEVVLGVYKWQDLGYDLSDEQVALQVAHEIAMEREIEIKVLQKKLEQTKEAYRIMRGA